MYNCLNVILYLSTVKSYIFAEAVCALQITKSFFQNNLQFTTERNWVVIKLGVNTAQSLYGFSSFRPFFAWEIGYDWFPWGHRDVILVTSPKQMAGMLVALKILIFFICPKKPYYFGFFFNFSPKNPNFFFNKMVVTDVISKCLTWILHRPYLNVSFFVGW